MKPIYENLDEVWLDLNRSFLTKPEEMVQYTRGAQGFIEDLVIKVKEPVTTINLHEVAFEPQRKWNHLIKSYIEPEEYWDFWEKVPKVTGTSYQFRFKNRKGPNGPCLIALVLTRESSGTPWTRAKVLWRTAELQRKWAADLVLIHNFFREVPEECKDMIQLKEVTLYLAQAFQSWRLVGPVIHLFCDMNEVNQEHDFTRKALESYERVYEEPQPEIKFAPVRRMQRHHLRVKNGEIGYTHPNELSLVEEVRKLERRN